MSGAASIDVFLQPGEYFVGDAMYAIRTLLGSCVSITLWHPERKVGAMSHFLLPQRATDIPSPPDGRYGEEALWLMLCELERLDIEPSQCKAKIFGGGNMFPGNARGAAQCIGRKNGEAARALLAAHGIDIVSESLYGVGHRQIVFEVRSGDVWVRQMKLAESF
jgi:chemotaxis protein CheD